MVAAMNEFSEVAESLAIVLRAEFSGKAVIEPSGPFSRACSEGKEFMRYDIIGDIHGHADALLEALLTDLGYSNKGGAWRHPARQALFVGDFIDRARSRWKPSALCGGWSTPDRPVR